MSTDSQRTEPDAATWDYWPQAPTGDFARFIPHSSEARKQFNRRCLTMDQMDQYSASFMYFAPASDQVTSMMDIPSDMSLHDDEEPRSTSAVPPEGMHVPHPSCVTGFYRFNMTDPTVKRPLALGWILGSGEYKKDPVPFALAPKESRVHRRHLTIRRSSETGKLVAVSVGRWFNVQGDEFHRWQSGERPALVKHRERVLEDGDVVHITSKLSYKLHYLPIDPAINKQEMLRARESMPDQPQAPLHLFTPTPFPTITGDYTLTPPFAVGTYGNVCYATSKASGRAYAVKVQVCSNETLYRLAKGEADILDKCHHPSICTLENVYDSTTIPMPMPPSNIRQVTMVMSPALQYTLADFYSDRSWPADCRLTTNANDNNDNELEVLRTTLLRDMILQCSSALEYLHRELEIMHRDMKLENTGLFFLPPRPPLPAAAAGKDEAKSRSESKPNASEPGQQSSSNPSPSPARATTPAKFHLYLLDFGHATQNRNSTDHTKGTLRYLAPEVMSLKKHESVAPYSFPVDIWGLGWMCWEIWARRRVGSWEEGMKVVEDLRERRDGEMGMRGGEDEGRRQFVKLAMREMLQVDPRRRIEARELHKWGMKAFREDVTEESR